MYCFFGRTMEEPRRPESRQLVSAERYEFGTSRIGKRFLTFRLWCTIWRTYEVKTTLETLACRFWTWSLVWKLDFVNVYKKNEKQYQREYQNPFVVTTFRFCIFNLCCDILWAHKHYCHLESWRNYVSSCFVMYEYFCLLCSIIISTLCFLLKLEKFLVIYVTVKLLKPGGSSALNGK